MMNDYEWTTDMGFCNPLGPIDESNKGGVEYETACRQMVLAGVRYMAEHPRQYMVEEIPNVVGLVRGKEAEDEALLEHMAGACSALPTGGMVHAAVTQCMFVQAAGSWDEYVRIRREVWAEYLAEEDGCADN